MSDVRRGVLACALVLTLGASAVACSGGEDPPEESRPAASGSTAPKAAPPIATFTTLKTVTGRLRPAARAQVKRQVAEVVDAWVDAAYVGSYPRSFDTAFAGFTRGARADARRDAGLLSNERIAGQITAATATQRRLRLDVLASRGRAVGVTADLVLDFDTTGDLARSVRVSGELFLTRDGGWQVFGYDLARGRMAAKPAAGATAGSTGGAA